MSNTKVSLTDTGDGVSMPSETSATIYYSVWRSQKNRIFKEKSFMHGQENNKIEIH